jgi:hypothetical protein
MDAMNRLSLKGHLKRADSRASLSDRAETFEKDAMRRQEITTGFYRFPGCGAVAPRLSYRPAPVSTL